MVAAAGRGLSSQEARPRASTTKSKAVDNVGTSSPATPRKRMLGKYPDPLTGTGNSENKACGLPAILGRDLSRLSSELLYRIFCPAKTLRPL